MATWKPEKQVWIAKYFKECCDVHNKTNDRNRSSGRRALLSVAHLWPDIRAHGVHQKL